ncbi:MAG: TetR/AcrR family transcriptional regulator [Hyphomonadaceae bacterium]|nr:TetR/AcrR family transcriptional regulator [Hyphomonadaceae bacterium]
MAGKIAAAVRKPKTTRAPELSNIPTTIKNPQRVAYRRTELVEVATKLFLERGFHGTSIRDIARACSFNVASLYMYVSSKEDILFLVAQDLMNDISVKLSETILDPGSPVRSLEIGFASYCRIVNRHRRQVRLLYREVGFLPPDLRSHVLGTVSNVVSFFEKIVERGVAGGVFRPVPVRLAALDMMMVAHMLALHTREVMSFTDLDGYIKFQLDSIFAGLLVADAKRRSDVSVSARRK